MAMLGNLVAMLENVVTALGRKMTMMEILLLIWDSLQTL